MAVVIILKNLFSNYHQKLNEMQYLKHFRAKQLWKIYPTSVAYSQGGGGARAPPHWPVKYAKSHVFGEKMKTVPPKGNWVPKLWSRCRDSAWKSVWISDFGLKIRLNFGKDLFLFFFFLEITCFWAEKAFEFRNFGFWPKNLSQFRWRPFFLKITSFWTEKAFKYRILAKKSVSISVKTFFFMEITYFWAEKAFEFPSLAEISVSILRINRPKLDKSCDSDSRTIKIRVKVVCSFLTLSKKPPPFFKSWLRACPTYKI